MIDPGFSKPIIPDFPLITSLTSLSFLTQRIITSEEVAISERDSHILPLYFDFQIIDFSWLLLNTETWKFFLERCPAIGAPITPRPTKPILFIFVFFFLIFF